MNTEKQACVIAANLPFNLSVVTKYSNGKITASMYPLIEVKESVRVEYKCALSGNENHLVSVVKLLEKIEVKHGKKYTVIGYTYNEKNTGYIYLVQEV